jgi:serine/threonine protein kinase
MDQDRAVCVAALDDLIRAKTREEENRRNSVAKRARTDWQDRLESVLKCRSKSSYERLSSLGEGSYSTVYLVKEKGKHFAYNSYILATGHQFALKKLYFTRGEVPTTVLREIRNLLACAHENVIQLKEVVLSSSKQFSLVFEHCEMDLHTLYESTNLLGEPGYRKDVFSQMLHALAYLEESFILHRDVKVRHYLLPNSLPFST